MQLTRSAALLAWLPLPQVQVLQQQLQAANAAVAQLVQGAAAPAAVTHTPGHMLAANSAGVWGEGVASRKHYHPTLANLPWPSAMAEHPCAPFAELDTMLAAFEVSMHQALPDAWPALVAAAKASAHPAAPPPLASAATLDGTGPAAPPSAARLRAVLMATAQLVEEMMQRQHLCTAEHQTLQRQVGAAGRHVA